MNDKKHVNFIKSIINAIKFNRLSGANGTSLRLRLFAFFAAFTLFILAAFLLILMGFGISFSGSSTLKENMENTLSLMSDQIYKELNTLTIQGISMSDKLSNDIDKFLHKNNLDASMLKDSPEYLEPLLSEQAPYLLNTLEYTSCSGAFIMLDATVNPDLTNAKTSKSGLFIIRTTPNAIGNKGSKLHYLRGPASIAREHDIELLGQWKMEYDTTNQDFWFDVMEVARNNPQRDLSRLCYYTDKVTLKDSVDSSMLLIIPLRNEDGFVYGTCGLQFSSMYFKYQYSPDNTKYSSIFLALAPAIYSNTIDLNNSLIAGNSYLTGMNISSSANIATNSDDFVSFELKDGSDEFAGLYQSIRLYPNDSPYSNLNPELCVLMQKGEFEDVVSGNSIYLIIFIIILLALSLVLSLFISNRYIRPLTDAFENIKEQNYNILKNKYFEINDLMEFLSQKDEELQRLQEASNITNNAETDEGLQKKDSSSRTKVLLTESASDSITTKVLPADNSLDNNQSKEYLNKNDLDNSQRYTLEHTNLQLLETSNNDNLVDSSTDDEQTDNVQSMLKEFTDNIQLLSNAEMAVFNLYLEGYKAYQIADILCLSINTIKTHNRRIYAKLNVSSRSELLLYVNLMKNKRMTS